MDDLAALLHIRADLTFDLPSDATRFLFLLSIICIHWLYHSWAWKMSF